MHLPPYWRQASFTIAESAALIGATEEALRNWLARNVSVYVGEKTGKRIHLRSVDVYYWALVHEMTKFGVPVRVALIACGQYAREAAHTLPDDEFLTVRTVDGETTFELTNDPRFSQSTLVVPLRAYALDLLDRMAVVYATEESGPSHKIGTVNGQPIAEWRAGIEAELERMPVNQ